MAYKFWWVDKEKNIQWHSKLDTVASLPYIPKLKCHRNLTLLIATREVPTVGNHLMPLQFKTFGLFF